MSRPENENPKERIEKTARELRKHRPRPSEALVSRIERLAERSTERRRSRPTRIQFSRRKLVYALAAALVVATVGAIVHSEFQQNSRPVAREQLITHGTQYGALAVNDARRKLIEKTPSKAQLSKLSPPTLTGNDTTLNSLAGKPSGAAATQYSNGPSASTDQTYAT